MWCPPPLFLPFPSCLHQYTQAVIVVRSCSSIVYAYVVAYVCDFFFHFFLPFPLLLLLSSTLQVSRSAGQPASLWVRYFILSSGWNKLVDSSSSNSSSGSLLHYNYYILQLPSASPRLVFFFSFLPFPLSSLHVLLLLSVALAWAATTVTRTHIASADSAFANPSTPRTHDVQRESARVHACTTYAHG